LTILDRYLIREILLPFLLWLLLLTFVLMMPPILDYAEQFIAKGVPWLTIVRVLLTLAPQALGITIPMALLLGILIGLGRLSADREFVVLQACGVSLFRVLRPIVVTAVLACAATAYVMIVALPNANQTFRQISFNIIASKAESDIKPRVFFTQFPSRVLYVRDADPQAGGWRDVFLADETRPGETTVYFAREGQLLVDREKRIVELGLARGTRHTAFGGRPESYDVSSFDRLVLNMDAETVFPRVTLMKGDNEMTIAELRRRIADNEKAGQPTGSQFYTIQQKFAIPVACLVLALIGVGLGVSNRRDGKLAGFVIASRCRCGAAAPRRGRPFTARPRRAAATGGTASSWSSGCRSSSCHGRHCWTCMSRGSFSPFSCSRSCHWSACSTSPRSSIWPTSSFAASRRPACC
jgi:lipopolysaccharide export system permease protein